MTCRMVEVENNLGRSLVIDLNANGPSKFRQIDHRSIDFIIHENIKYVLKKGAKKPEPEEYKKDEPKWDTSKLVVGNWFSGTRYYQAVEAKGEQILCRSQGTNIDISKDVLEYEMHNSAVFSEVQKISLTQVATLLADANSKCFTVCFTTKVDDKMVAEKLKDVKAKLNAAQARQLAKEVLVGKETELIGRLSRSEGKLGRSLVIDLPSQGYRQVDHRTLRWLIVEGVKYTVKR
mmetsp:Transcript_3863/g.4503  ORF Transcript_3863/g.4503 Transcript_3863/m.4503 type:complete len:234 (-) Transcript_3863:103-804(-)